jgi:hypothetical protein
MTRKDTESSPELDETEHLGAVCIIAYAHSSALIQIHVLLSACLMLLPLT